MSETVPSDRRAPAAAVAAIAAVLVAAAPPADAQWIADGDRLRVGYGPSTLHRHHSEEHVDFNHLVALEWVTTRFTQWRYWKADRALLGLALFDNSFGQFTQYLYVGQEWDLWPLGPGRVYANATIGLIHGYKAPYDDKIPLNGLGVAPAIIPTLGWRTGRFGLGVSLLGLNGVMASASWEFGR